MEKPEYLIIVFLIFITILINVFSTKSQKIYFFINPKDQNSINLLNNILKNSKNEIILVSNNSDKKILQNVVNKLNQIRPISKVLDIENFSDLKEVVYESCFKNAKCIFQPWDKFYSINNRLNVFGYPFNFEKNVKQPSNTASDSKGNAVFDKSTLGDRNVLDYDCKSKDIVDKKMEILLANQNPQMSCTNTRSSRGF